jgi:uncharacterized protein (DUF1015 family)
VPRFEPFRALRYTAGVDLDEVIAPPYDVLSDADVEQLRARSPHNIVHADVPAGAGADRYAEARRVLDALVDSGVLARDDEPCFTIYRMRFVDERGEHRDLVGVLGALEVVDEGAGGVLPHERTTPKASTDRLDLTRATRANLSPVWGLALGRGLTDALAAPGEPVGSLTVDGVLHSVERVTEADRIAEIQAAVGGDDVLIADGHHRYGVARTYRAETREAANADPSDSAAAELAEAAETTLAFVGELVPEQLAIEAIHRLYADGDPEAVRAALTEHFDVTEAPQPGPTTLTDMSAEGRLLLLTADGGASWLTPKVGAFDGIRAIDGALLEHALRDVDGVEVAYQHGVDAVQEALAEGRAHTAVLIRPVSIEEIERTGREGLLMPPKSTFFTPKLRTGLVVRPLP